MLDVIHFTALWNEYYLPLYDNCVQGRRKQPNNFDENIEKWTCANNLLKDLVHVSSLLKKTTILIPLLKVMHVQFVAIYLHLCT